MLYLLENLWVIGCRVQIPQHIVEFAASSSIYERTFGFAHRKEGFKNRMSEGGLPAESRLITTQRNACVYSHTA